MKVKSDIEIIALCKAGNDDAFDELYRRFYPKAYYLALKISKNEMDAQDAAQEAMIEAKASLHKLQNNQYFKLWLNKIVLGKCSRIFKQNKYPSYNIQSKDHFLNLKESRIEYQPDEYMHLVNDQSIIRHLMEGLSDDHREVLNLMYFKEMSLREIADELHISLGTVKSRTYAARRQMKRLIRAFEEENDITLDFKSSFLSTIAVSSLYVKFSQFLHTHITNSTTHILIIKAMVASAALVMFSSAVFAYQSQNQNDDRIALRAISANDESDKETKPKFHPISLTSKKEVITSAKDAYFYLLLWAESESSLQVKEAHDFIDAQRIYEELKASRSVYYEQLENIGWCKQYEILKK